MRHFYKQKERKPSNKMRKTIRHLIKKQTMRRENKKEEDFYLRGEVGRDPEIKASVIDNNIKTEF